VRVEYCEVRRRIAPYNSCRSTSTIDERNTHSLRALNDVLVGEHVSIRSDNDTRASAATRALRIVRITSDVDADDSGAYLIDRTDDGTRVRVERIGTARLGRGFFERRSFERHGMQAWGPRRSNSSGPTDMLDVMEEARKVREFWFGKLPLPPADLEKRMRLWFGSDLPPLHLQKWDESIRKQFEPLVQQALAGELDQWADGPRRRLSLILVLDQFPRNIYRGLSKAFAGDEKALALALSGIHSGADAALDPVERMFFYMPLQHSELRDVQDESVAAFKRLAMEAPENLKATFEQNLDYAKRHRDVIMRFGRFPHRNRMLGRLSTPEENTYMKEGGEDFSK
jgi:uncharacterized protein (DUF924 family)